MIDTLPDTLAALLRTAIHDLKKIENNPKYQIRMDVWHSPLQHGGCMVCMAGACLVERGLPDNQLVYHVSPKLRAINFLRVGNVRSAYETLYQRYSGTLDNFSVKEYDNDSDQFYEDLEKVLEYLDKEKI